MGIYACSHPSCYLNNSSSSRWAESGAKAPVKCHYIRRRGCRWPQTSNGGGKNRKHDGNMAVLFVSCIDLRNIKKLVSSSFDTDDVFISSSGVWVTCFIYIMVHLLNVPTALLCIVFLLIDQFSTSPMRENVFAIFRLFTEFYAVLTAAHGKRTVWTNPDRS